MSDPGGDALYPVIGGTNVPGLDLTGNKLSLSASGTLTVTMKVADLSARGVAAAAAAVTGAQFLQYVTRWQMGNTIYYAMMETTPAQAAAGQYHFYAGQAQSIDLCSVSACDPHAIYYPEAPATGGNTETGNVTCPATPTLRTPCNGHDQRGARRRGLPHRLQPARGNGLLRVRGRPPAGRRHQRPRRSRRTAAAGRRELLLQLPLTSTPTPEASTGKCPRVNPQAVTKPTGDAAATRR